jgi:PAS domain S-box-containing protein
VPLVVLLVSETPECLRAARDQLPKPWLVELCRSREEAVALLDGRTFDAVIVDTSGQEGLATLVAVRDHAPTASLIAVIAEENPELAFEAVHRGAHECLIKSQLDGRTLSKAIRHAVDRKWLGAFLAERERLLDAAFRAQSAAIVVLDAAGHVVLANDAWERMIAEGDDALTPVRMGADLGEALARLPSPEAAGVAEGLRLVLDGTLARYQGEYERTTRGGEARTYAIQVDPLPHGTGGVVVTHTDTTRRREIERRVRRSGEELSRLLAMLPEGVAVHRQGRFVWANDAIRRALRYERVEDLLGKPIVDVVHPDELALVAERIRLMNETGAAAPPRETRLICADGSVFLAEIEALPIHYEDEPAILVIGRDVSERRALTARMMQMDRVMNIGLLVAGLGHEINNPLAFVAGNVDVALRSAVELERLLEKVQSQRVDPEHLDTLWKLGTGLKDIRAALTDARQGARRVRAIVQDLRAFARPEESGSAPVLIEPVLEASLNMVRNEIRHRARLVKELAPGVSVIGNESRLGQVFLNLLTNAAHAIPAGEADKHQITVRSYPAADRVVIEISDTGSGIAAADLPRVFEPFFTTKPVGQGTGLGLAICRDTVFAMGGEIQIESELGKGTTVRVSLPASARPAALPESSKVPPQEMPSSLRVLVVDDEPLIGRVVARCLGRDHVVQSVTTGREALDTLMTAEPYDVVFLDVMMPDMSGIDVYRALERDAPGRLSRVVFLTGGAFTAEARSFLDRVPNRRVHKPFEARELRAVAEEVARSQ